MSDSDKKEQERAKLVEGYNASTDARINSWQDLYDMLKAQAAAFVAAPRASTGIATIDFLLSFVLALEDLPEEQDAKAIARRMNHIIVYQGDRTGIACTLPSEEDTAQQNASAIDRLGALLGVMGKLSEYANQIPKDVEEEPPPLVMPLSGKRTLH